MKAKTHLARLNKRLRLRSTALTVANRQLKQEIVHRLTVEVVLRKKERHFNQLLERSRGMQKQLRHLSHQLLVAQEEERKQISRELHDEIAQTLTGINTQLATLKGDAVINARNLKEKITRTQRFVEKSVNIVHRFARELRPTILDDLGLIPALHSHMKDLAKRSGIRFRFTAFHEVEKLKGTKRTILYRVAQSALTNIIQHAHATLIRVSIQKLPHAIRMQIHDNGKGFQVEEVLYAKGRKRLGMLGMRERVEMVGGHFSVESTLGKGTRIQAQIPFNHGHKGGQP